jgi:hypothetical protein
MQPSSNNHVMRPPSLPDPANDTPARPIPTYKGPIKIPTTAQLSGIAPPPSNLHPGQMPKVTRQLVVNRPRITHPLSASGPLTTAKLPTRIPATEKRRVAPVALPPRRRHPVALMSVLGSILIMVVLTLSYVAPLGGGQQPTELTQAFTTIFSIGSSNFVSPSRHLPTPTPTPALLTNEGSCNQPSLGLWGTCATSIPKSGNIGTGQMQRPMKNATITQAFGVPEYQSWCVCVRPHTGIDLAAPYDTPVMAADNGQVIWTGWDWSGLGWAVKIDHGNYIGTVYGHLARYIVKTGQDVKKGDIIAYEGSTGASTGPHLHFMVFDNNRWKNPTLYVALP